MSRECILCVCTTFIIFTIVPPSQPTLSGSAISALTVQLTWTRPIGSITNYTITYNTMGQPSVSLFVGDPNALESIVENLSSNTTYQFQIQAVNQYGASPLSNTVSLTTHPPSGKFIDTYLIYIPFDKPWHSSCV